MGYITDIALKLLQWGAGVKIGNMGMDSWRQESMYILLIIIIIVLSFIYGCQK